ncbi:VOC family protein [Williamsia phyllosphaerae]|uniref:VOC family protein n=1 Tax=Williamsia phyllosphaerae TaxID=885042 RepID=A0ABQ1V3M1_9NOCA|nr:VOC family protein [Williamsia phyllosphaerae]GGF33654.1 VOC family protein [Williamsia phyllosphaerae]
MASITPSLWFNEDLEEALELYTSVFPDTTVHGVNRSSEDGPVLSAEFELVGQRFMALNYPSDFRFTEAVSLVISCADQAEVDHYWDQLVVGGEESQCGWLRDRFGLSWQIVPTRLYELLSDPDPARANGAIQAMLQMQKIVIADLEAGADNA